jgi:sugar/nucleoside kinase (ribokinase family)
MIDFVTFGIVTDDIVFPDGRTAMGVLGGGGPQTALGMRMCSSAVGLVASVNDKEYPAIKSWLNDSGIDSAGLRPSSMPTPRAWQIFEANGRRTQLWRVTESVIAGMLEKSLEKIPDEYGYARGYHLGIHPDEPDVQFIEDLRKFSGLVSLELFKPASRPPTLRKLRALLTQVDIVSTNLLEAQSIVGPGSLKDIILRLFAAGAPLVTLRLGPSGSIVASQKPGRMLKIPAVSVSVIDTLGAGNAYCGGFLAGWVKTQDLAAAGAWGAVAASFLLEQVGIPIVTKKLQSIAEQRFKDLLPAIRDFSDGESF